MAKFQIVIPYVVREIVSEIEQDLDRHFGVPMNLTIPDMGEDDEGKPGKATVHFEGSNFKLNIITGVGHFGRWISVKEIKATMNFWSKEAAEEWIGKLQKYAGPVEWEFDSLHGGEGKLKFVVEGIALVRLQTNASSRRNGLPIYQWDDPNHPLNHDKH